MLYDYIIANYDKDEPIFLSELPFVFKGGTSLSKAYNLIDRFSEDIDLSMNRKATEGERKTSKELIVSIADSLGMTLMNPDIPNEELFGVYEE